MTGAESHPLARALRELNLTQQQLADRVNRLRRRRPNGKRIRLTQGFVSSILHGKPVSVPMAKAIAEAVGGVVAATDLLLYEQPRGQKAS